MTSAAKSTRKALRVLRGRRNPDLGLSPIDRHFGIAPPHLWIAGVGMPDFSHTERLRRRAADKRARTSRRINRGKA